MIYRTLIITALLLISNSGFADRLLDSMPRTMAAKSFTLPYSTSGDFSLDELQGAFTIVNFWTVKCASCRAELTLLEDLKQQLAKENITLNIVAVHAGDDVDSVNEQIKVSPVSYAVVMDMDLELGHWGIQTMPTSYVLTPKGNFAYRAQGSRMWNSPQMINFIKRVVADYESNDTSS